MRSLLRTAPPALLALLAATALTGAALTGCKDSALEPERFGAIDGIVRDFDSNAPIGGAGLTTSPPSGALVTGPDGTFHLDNVLVGNYTLTATKAGYDPNTVTVAVLAERTTQATLFLSQEEDTTAVAVAAMTAEVLNFTNEPDDDSTEVRAQYRIANTGTVSIPSYEVYFRIETTGQTYYHEQQGEELGVSQLDIGDFTEYIGQDSATAVVVDTFYFDGQDPAQARGRAGARARYAALRARSR